MYFSLFAGDGSFSGFVAFLCDFETPIDMGLVCNGNADCQGGDDETTTLCESELTRQRERER